MKYVEYNVWNGKIYKISGSPILPTKSTNSIVTLENDSIIEEIYNGTKSLESAFIGIYKKAYNKDGTIHLPKPKKELFEIPLYEKNNTPDVSLVLYTNNKLMEVIINYKALKTWYNHRMKDKFSFKSSIIFKFIITKNDKEIITIEKESKDFLSNFQTTIDLSDIKDLEDIKISTFKIFETYSLKIEKNKYYDLDIKDIGFCQSTNNALKYNVVISKTNKKNHISIELINIDLTTIYKSLDFYITGGDPNELHDVLSIPIEELWDTRYITKEIKTDIENKIIWCNNKTLNILINKKVVKIQ